MSQQSASSPLSDRTNIPSATNCAEITAPTKSSGPIGGKVVATNDGKDKNPPTGALNSLLVSGSAAGGKKGVRNNVAQVTEDGGTRIGSKVKKRAADSGELLTSKRTSRRVRPSISESSVRRSTRLAKVAPVVESLNSPPGSSNTSEKLDKELSETDQNDESAEASCTSEQSSLPEVDDEITQPATAADRPQMIFCCDSMTRADPNCLFTVNNQTCVARRACILLGDELKTFHYPIPAATANGLKKNDYLIQVLKYIPATTHVIATASRIKTIIATADTPSNEGKRNWAMDKSVVGVQGRFFIECDNGRMDMDGHTIREPHQSIWCEVNGMGIGPKGIKKLGGYSKLNESMVEFVCDAHQDEKWVAIFWLKNGGFK